MKNSINYDVKRGVKKSEMKKTLKWGIFLQKNKFLKTMFPPPLFKLAKF